MMKIIIKLKKRAFIKIIGSLFAECILIFMVVYSYINNEDFFEMLFCCILFSVAAIIHFFQGINILKSGTKNLNKYIKNSKYSFEELDKEMKQALKLDSVFVGKNHAFLITNNGLNIIDINSIIKVELRHYGENIAKARKGYYRLVFFIDGTKTKYKIYFMLKKNAMEVIKEIKKINSEIIVNLN